MSDIRPECGCEDGCDAPPECAELKRLRQALTEAESRAAARERELAERVRQLEGVLTVLKGLTHSLS